MRKWVNEGIAMASGAVIAALLLEAAHVPDALSGAIIWIIVAAAFAAVVDNALNGPMRLARALVEESVKLDARIERLEWEAETIKNLVDNHY